MLQNEGTGAYLNVRTLDNLKRHIIAFKCVDLHLLWRNVKINVDEIPQKLVQATLTSSHYLKCQLDHQLTSLDVREESIIK